MQRYLAGRILQAIVSLLVVFVLARLTGDPLEIMMPAEATKEDIAMMRAYLGLDRPWPIQYWRFISRAVQGDFGRSVRFNRPALAVVTERYPATLELGGLAILVVLALGLPVGVYAAVRRNSPLDYVSRGVAALGQAVPPFWLGLVLLHLGIAWHAICITALDIATDRYSQGPNGRTSK
jgi:peptide/nickel transport system permease protein